MARDTQPEVETKRQSVRIPCNLLGKLLDHGRASADAVHMLAIKLARFNREGNALNEHVCREEYGIRLWSFRAGLRLLTRTKVLARSQPNRRYAVEEVVDAGGYDIEIDARLLTERSTLVAFILAVNLSPEPLTPTEAAQRIGIGHGRSRSTIRKLAREAVGLGAVVCAKAARGAVFLGRMSNPINMNDLDEKQLAKKQLAKKRTTHTPESKSIQPENKGIVPEKVSAAREPRDVQRQQDEIFSQQLKGLISADLAGVLAPKLKRNARGLGAFLAGQAKTHAVSTGEIVEIIKEALPDHLMDENIRQVTTWSFYTRRIAKQLRLRHMTTEGIRPGDVLNTHKRMDDNEQP